MERKTVFSPCERYRYTLWRDFKTYLLDVPVIGHGNVSRDGYANFLMLNPSTATATLDDPTIRRCIGFAKAWGFGALAITNIFAWRDTDPRKMKAATDPIGPENDHWIQHVARRAAIVICAWGNDGDFLNRGVTVKNVLTSLTVPCYCLGMTATNQPRHPLYLRRDSQPTLFNNL